SGSAAARAVSAACQRATIVVWTARDARATGSSPPHERIRGEAFASLATAFGAAHGPDPRAEGNGAISCGRNDGLKARLQRRALGRRARGEIALRRRRAGQPMRVPVVGEVAKGQRRRDGGQGDLVEAGVGKEGAQRLRSRQRVARRLIE